MNNKIKILLSVGISLILVKAVAPLVFVADTPTINRYALLDLRYKTVSWFSQRAVYLSSVFNRQKTTELNEDLVSGEPKKMEFETIENLPLSSFNRLAKGVYALEKDDVVYTRINPDEMQWIEKKVILDGKEVTIEIAQ